MELEIDPDWPARMIEASMAVTSAERNRLASLARSGQLVRLARGVYMEAQRAADRTPASGIATWWVPASW